MKNNSEILTLIFVIMGGIILYFSLRHFFKPTDVTVQTPQVTKIFFPAEGVMCFESVGAMCFESANGHDRLCSVPNATACFPMSK